MEKSFVNSTLFVCFFSRTVSTTTKEAVAVLSQNDNNTLNPILFLANLIKSTQLTGMQDMTNGGQGFNNDVNLGMLLVQISVVYRGLAMNLNHIDPMITWVDRIGGKQHRAYSVIKVKFWTQHWSRTRVQLRLIMFISLVLFWFFFNRQSTST